MIFVTNTLLYTNTPRNQSVENVGVAFVKGANERNKFFEKNKQTVMYDEQVRTNKAKDLQSQKRTDLGMNPGRCIIAQIEQCRYFQ